MQHELFIAGFGGQGVMFAGQLLAYAAMEESAEVTWIPSYGPEMRGGTAHCSVVISDSQIGSPLVQHPEIALLFNNPSFDKYEPTVVPGGVLVYNASMVQRTSSRSDIQALAIPATEIAHELGDVRITNVVMLGAAMALRPILKMASLRHALEKHLPPRHRDTLPLNLEALSRGAAAVPRLTQ